jgi:hypothetical protein
MNECCDRCGARAAYFVTRDTLLRLFFCVECVIGHFPELMEQQWVLWPVDVASIAPSQAVDASRLHWPDLLT